VAATAGILLAAPLVSGGRWVTVTLVATVAAQAAVAPLLLHHFGSVPLLAPLTNLAAAPLVAASTIVGGIGAVAHVGALVAVGVWIAGVVLAIARGAAGLPQLTTAAVIGLFGAAFAAVRVRALRPPAAVAAAVLVLSTLVPAGPPDAPTVVFLDVGQGDAALLLGPSGEVILIDGGPEPAILREHLRNRSIARIDLLVVSHRHADHVAGLDGITGTMPVGRLWYPPQLGEGSVLDSLVDQARAAGTVVETPGEGTMARIGAFSIEVLAPLRRYVSPNDGSIVLRVQAAGASIIFSGDIEAIAQGELGPLPADILKVPHQGSATSDLDWIRDSAPRVAVISVGPNDFGHPSEEVVEALRLAGADVRRTDQDGSIVLRLDQVAALPSAP
jgi:competence protein ComEC